MSNTLFLDSSTVENAQRMAAPTAYLGTADAGVGTATLSVAFLAALLPFAMSWVLTYPDEPQYLDAAVIMCQTNDWLMPACPNGAAPEDMKPILTYWLIALSFKLFGASVAAARLPYLLAAVVVIGLTYRLTLLLSASRTAAGLACALLLCNPIFWLSAVRSIPDIWLCLFLLISAHGCIGLLMSPVPKSSHAFMAYLGVGLAVLTKGVPALVFIGYAFGFAWLNPWRPKCWRRLVHGPAMALGVAISLSWFAAVLLVDGADHLKFLWSDQVGTRAQLNPLIIGYRFPLAMVGLGLASLPFCWPLLRARGGVVSLLPDAKPDRVGHGFIAGWGVVNVFAMCAAADWYLRYLLPAVPLLSALLGAMLVKVDGEMLTRCFNRLLAGALALLAAFTAIALVFAVRLGFTKVEIAAGLTLALVAAASAIVGHRGPWLRTSQATAVIMLLVTPAAFLGASKVARIDLEDDLVRRVQRDHVGANRVIGFAGPKGPASRLRLALADRATVLQWEALPESEDLPALLVFPEQMAARLPADQYTVQPVGSLFASPDDSDVVRALLDCRLVEFLSQSRAVYFIAIRSH